MGTRVVDELEAQIDELEDELDESKGARLLLAKKLEQSEKRAADLCSAYLAKQKAAEARAERLASLLAEAAADINGAAGYIDNGTVAIDYQVRAQRLWAALAEEAGGESNV